jgi:hypothetical protein
MHEASCLLTFHVNVWSRGANYNEMSTKNLARIYINLKELVVKTALLYLKN